MIWRVTNFPTFMSIETTEDTMSFDTPNWTSDMATPPPT